MRIYDDIYHKAISIIRHHQTTNPKQILEDRGVNIIPFRSKTKLLGMYTVIKRNRFVFYNPDVNENMLRMIFAHELGHDILHRKEAKSHQLHEFELFDVNSMMETEANLFACHLLINEDELQSLASQGYTYDQISSELGVNINLLLYKISEMNRRGKSYNMTNTIDNKFFKNIDVKKIKDFE
ncbi:MAG: ImmA/IrrE family metallo-endopeptidase [Tissierellia bacterium]|nr:ImmA/IrrE family metallo-endopeptidase [Tissierellia bacterium]